MGRTASKCCIIRAPSNLGLRPPASNRQPGTWRAPQALTAAGLIEAILPATVLDVDRPVYDPKPEAGTRLYNGHRIRTFNLALAELVERASARNQFPLVVGGDCSILLGALAGVRRAGPVSLIHVDGHSDFRHPGNYDPTATLGAVAGMDLALATGRGEALMTDWPGVASPLVPERQVIQIGEREGLSPDFAWPDVKETAMTRIDVFAARQLGSQAVLDQTNATLGQEPGWPFWVHFDVDVLDQTIMPDVDTPGSPGIDLRDVTAILRSLVAAPHCRGMSVTIFDPDFDPTGGLAVLLVHLLKDVLDGRVSGARESSVA